MIEGVRGTSIGVGRVVAMSSICLESSAKSCEYMLTYFWGKGHILLGGGVEIFAGDEYPHPPWICTPRVGGGGTAKNSSYTFFAYKICLQYIMGL